MQEIVELAARREVWLPVASATGSPNMTRDGRRACHGNVGQAFADLWLKRIRPFRNTLKLLDLFRSGFICAEISRAAVILGRPLR